MDDIGRLSPFMAEVAQQAGLNDKNAKRLRLAVEEAVANIINYGHATSITLQATLDNPHLQLSITDDVVPFDPTAASPTDFSIPPEYQGSLPTLRIPTII